MMWYLYDFAKGTPPGNYYVAVKQVYKEQEVCRVTWMLVVEEKKKSKVQKKFKQKVICFEMQVS